MKTFRVRVVYQMSGYVEVQADDVDDAIQEAIEAPLPSDASYVEGSFEIDSDMEVIEVVEPSNKWGSAGYGPELR